MSLSLLPCDTARLSTPIVTSKTSSASASTSWIQHRRLRALVHRGDLATLAECISYVAVGALGAASRRAKCFTAGRHRCACRRTSFAAASDLRPDHVADHQVVLVLGLDGVLCEGSREATLVGISAAHDLWPDIMGAAADIDPRDAGVRQSWVGYDWGSYFEDPPADGQQADSADVHPTWLLEKVRRLRSAADADWELALIARVCVEEAVACRERRRAGAALSRPLSAGEIEANWTDGLRETLLAKWTASRETCEAAVVRQREKYFEKAGAVQPKGMTFYASVMEAIYVSAVCGAVHPNVYVVTCMDKLSATRALHARGEILQQAHPDVPMASPNPGPADDETTAELDAARVAQGGGWKLMSGLGTVSEVADAVQRIVDRHPGAQVAFVDSSVSVLQSVASRLRLGAVRLHFASWGSGHHTGTWSDTRGSLPRVLEVSEDDLERILCRGRVE